MFRKLVSLALLGAALVGVSNPTLAQASKTSFTVRIENVSGGGASGVKASGVFNRPVGAMQPGAAVPGAAFEFTVAGVPGDRLSFTTMFGQSNDWFFGPDEKGIALFGADGKPVSGDFSAAVKLWDAGTEVDEEPGKGPNQGPRQPAPNTGPAEKDGVVHLADASEAKITVPNAADYIKLTITSLNDRQFRVRIENISAKAALPTPVSPGLYVIHTGDAPIFSPGKADRKQGLENQSEDGNPVFLARAIGTTDKQIRLSPGVFVVHKEPNPIFTPGEVDRGQGLEAQSEDGNPANLAKALEAGKFSALGVFNTPVGASKAGAAGAGQAFEFTVDGAPGDYLSFTTMFGDSNDLFFGPSGYGIALFNAKGKPVNGDITIHVQLWDAGTEVNQEPFVGPDQAPRQKAPNTGASEKAPVQLINQVNDGFVYPSVFGMIKVTITAKDGEAMNMMEPAMMGTPAIAPTPAATASK